MTQETRFTSCYQQEWYTSLLTLSCCSHRHRSQHFNFFSCVSVQLYLHFLECRGTTGSPGDLNVDSLIRERDTPVSISMSNTFSSKVTVAFSSEDGPCCCTMEYMVHSLAGVASSTSWVTWPQFAPCGWFLDLLRHILAMGPTLLQL